MTFLEKIFVNDIFQYLGLVPGSRDQVASCTEAFMPTEIVWPSLRGMALVEKSGSKMLH